jgi:hypothetical protein
MTRVRVRVKVRVRVRVEVRVRVRVRVSKREYLPYIVGWLLLQPREWRGQRAYCTWWSFSVWMEVTVATGEETTAREECYWSHACSLQGVGTNGILECKIPSKNRRPYEANELATRALLLLLRLDRMGEENGRGKEGTPRTFL